jgi:RNA polymerase sigma-70 factor (ECF subfamily)
VTNTCLDMLRAGRRRVLPQDLAPSVQPGPPLTDMRSDIAWLEPYPDALLPESADPQAAAQLRESIRLAFIRAMQVLPPRQRAALILHDVLDRSVSEVAAMLETSDVAINSALQRGRATIARSSSTRVSDGDELAARHAEAIARFVHAWETGDFDGLVSMLAEEAVMSMPPWVYWLDGREAVAASLQSPATWGGQPRVGVFRLITTAMNGQPAALAYMRGPDDRFIPVCLTVLSLDREGRIDDLAVFVLPEYFSEWGFPRCLNE